MNKYSPNWQESDKQFLEALLLATGGEGGAPLQEVLLMADAVDGMVFTLKELEETLEKLVAAQVITIAKTKLSLNPAFLGLYEQATLQASAAEENDTLLPLLQNQRLTAATIEEAKTIVKQYKLKNQYQAYQEQFGG